MNIELNYDSRPFFPAIPVLSYDSETTGLSPHHGDKIFAISMSDGDDSWYLKVGDKLPSYLLDMFSDPKRMWYMWNAKFDMHFLFEQFGVQIAGTILDGMVLARLEFNDHLTYGLDACAKRIGLEKSDEVEKYITEHKLWEWETIPGKKIRKKNKHFDKVPHDIMMKYACKDAEVTFRVCNHLEKRVAEIDSLLPDAPKLASVALQEFLVTKAVFQMESGGLKIDEGYAEMALNFYQEEAKNAEAEFEKQTGKAYKASPKLFAEIFESEKDKWAYTEKGNPSFDSDAIKRFTHPVAKQILTLRDAKSRADFFASFAYFSDKNSFVHPTFNQAGTATGRFSSSEPNFQNLTNDEEAEEGTLSVRNAIIPTSSDYCIVSMDYDQQEYRMMLDYAGEMGLIDQVKAGVDVHQATADMMGVSRKYAKTLNFMLLYGGGVGKLAEALGISEYDAKKLRDLYFSKLPKVQQFIATVIRTAKQRGYVYNWMGRRYFCDPEFAYKMPNRIIQGGGADVMKKAIVGIAKILETKKSTLFLTVHDELDFYIHRDEFHLIPQIKKIMEEAYPHKHLPLTVSISHSWKSLGELEDGPPREEDRRPPDREVERPKVFGRGIGVHQKNEGGNGVPKERHLQESLLRAFGVSIKELSNHTEFRVMNSRLGEKTLYGGDKLLARVENYVLAYQAKQLGIDLDMFMG